MDKILEKIILNCRAGDLQAQQFLYEKYKNMLFPVCLRYARDRSEAQDLLQDAFLKIFRDLDQYRGEGAFEGWLRKVTVRTALMALRKKHPTRNALALEDIPQNTQITLPDEGDFDAKIILKMVQNLPDGYRTVFNLRCVEEYSYEEIAAELGIAESSVRSQYTRACRQLREWMNRIYGGRWTADGGRPSSKIMAAESILEVEILV